jgi:hypothetical protein
MQKLQQSKVCHFADPLKNGTKTSKMACNSLPCSSWNVFYTCADGTYQDLSSDVLFV